MKFSPIFSRRWSRELSLVFFSVMEMEMKNDFQGQTDDKIKISKIDNLITPFRDADFEKVIQFVLTKNIK